MTIVTRLAAAVEQKDWDRVGELITAHWSELTNDHRETFVTILGALPPAFLDAHQWQADSRAYAEFLPASGPVRPVRYRAPSTVPVTLLDVLSAATARSAGARMAGDHVASVRAADDAREALEDAADHVRAGLAHVLPDVCAQWGISYLLAGELERALEVFGVAYDHAIAAKNTRMAVEAAGNCALILALQGAIPAARRWLERMPALDDPSDTVADAGAIASALVAVDGLDHDDAQAAIVRFAADGVELEHWALRMYARVRAALVWERDVQSTLSAVNAEIAEKSPMRHDAGLNAVLIAIALADLRIRLGDLAGASAVVDAARGAVPRAFRNALRLVDARVAAGSGRPERARATLATVFGDEPMPRDVGAALVLRAALAADRDAAHVDLEAAGRWIREWQLASTVTLLPRAAWSDVTVVAPDGLFYAPPVPTERPGRLTARERSVLRRVALGATVAVIADEDHLSSNTVKKQLGSAYRKIGVRSRQAAVDAIAAAPWLLAE